MKTLFTLFFIGLISIGAISQYCLPDGISFGSQAEIDNFKNNYPNCTEIEGSVEIEGSTITNLDSLHLITSIGGYLEIYNVPNLTSITGLSALSSVGDGRLAIFGSSLVNLNGLENLITVPGLRIDGNLLLTSLEGLNSLSSAQGGVYIIGNPLLTDLNGLEDLVDVGQGGSLTITDNGSLSSLAGIDNIVFDPFYVTEIWITDNPLLSECEVESICNFLNDDGIIHVDGNATGCNTINEVRGECGTSVGELISHDDFLIYPNPVLSLLTIESNQNLSNTLKVSLSNLTGQEISTHSIAYPKTEIEVSNLPPGVYFVKIWNDRDVIVRKVIKQ